MFASLALLLLAGGPAPFALVNGTALPLTRVSVRVSLRAAEWRPLAPAPLHSGARTAVAALGGEECAWDIKAEAGGRALAWRDVNLCDVSVVTLRARGEILWVDYD